MTLGRRHLMMTIPMFVAAMGYNLWYFAKATDGVPARGTQAGPAPVQAAGPAVAGETAEGLDPTQIPPVPDVGLGTLPGWRRNPFVSARQPATAAADAAVVDAAQPDAQPDIVVGAILVSADRRRARVNGQNVTVGDRIGGVTVVDIQPTAIVVESPTEGRRTIAQPRRASGSR